MEYVKYMWHNIVSFTSYINTFKFMDECPRKEKTLLIIQGKLYDLTNFRHPGGDILLDSNGSDATNIFYSTHPQYVWKMIDTKEFQTSYLHDDNKVDTIQMRLNKCGNYVYDCDFYKECKKLVENHLKKRSITYGSYFDNCIIGVWTSFWVALCGYTYSTMIYYEGCISSCILLGITWAMGNFNIMHISMHGGICNNKYIKPLLDSTYTVFSGSATPRWIEKHNHIHHGHTNTIKDADKHASPFLRLHPHQDRRWWYKYQHIYFPLLACVNTLSNQFTHLKYMMTKTKDNGKLREVQVNRYYLSFSLWICLAYLYPMYSFGVYEGICSSLLFQMVGSVWATYNIVINHIFEQSHTSSESYQCSFAKMQIASSCNHYSGSMIMTFLTGGLNHQIEHHMFPSLHCFHLPLLSKDIKELCKKHNIVYNDLSTMSLIRSMHKTLQIYGTCEETSNLPGLGDYQSLMNGE